MAQRPKKGCRRQRQEKSEGVGREKTGDRIESTMRDTGKKIHFNILGCKTSAFY